MDGKAFVKVAKDSGLLDKKVSAAGMDLIFAKIKSAGESWITFD